MMSCFGFRGTYMPAFILFNFLCNCLLATAISGMSGLLLLSAASVVLPNGMPIGAVAALADDDDDDDDGPSASRSRGSGNLGPRRMFKLKPISEQGSGNRRTTARPASKPFRVRFEIVATGLSAGDMEALVRRGYRVLDETSLAALPGTKMKRLRVPQGISIEEARAEVVSLESTTAADLNHYYRPQVESDCTSAECEAYPLIGWNFRSNALCSRQPVIGMVDTAVNLKHDALKGRTIEVINLRDDKLKVSTSKHGTAIAALLAGSPDYRLPGLLPDAKLIAVDPYHQGEGADDRVNVYDLVRAIDLLIARVPDAINLSLSGPHNALLEDAVRAAHDAGIPIIAAAGNKGPKAEPSYPAAYDNVIAVTAIDRRYAVYRRAGQGEHIDFAAPGVNITTVAPIKGLRRNTGTSFAAPFVTAAVAVLKSANRNTNHEMLVELLAANALDLGETGRDQVFGWGLIRTDNLCGTLKSAPVWRQ